MGGRASFGVTRLPDGATVTQPTIMVIAENTDVRVLPDGAYLIPPNVPVEPLPDGGVRIGAFS
ncbi:hypothetical protein JCM9533A_30190 [Catenuloplanes niger JCM 9533]